MNRPLVDRRTGGIVACARLKPQWYGNSPVRLAMASECFRNTGSKGLLDVRSEQGPVG